MIPLLQDISAIGIVPVIKLDHPDNAVPLVRALADGGLPCAEITFRSDAAEESIRRVARECPDVLVGAGTVLTTEQADRAWAAGAKFIVSPGLSPKVVSHCLERGMPILPGATSPSEIETALEFGLDVVKFFPAEQSGGINFIKALSAPYTGLRFMPTGGISAKNLNDYLSFDKIVACGGSWMVPGDLIAAKDFDGITALTRQAVQTMLGFEILHIGVNAGGEEDAAQIAKVFCDLFGVGAKVGNSSIFSGSLVEVMKGNGRGTKGHIGIGVNSLPRARRYLERKGYKFDESTLKLDEKGRPTICYIEGEYGGFAVHFNQK